MGVFVIVYDTIYHLPDREGGVFMIGVGLAMAALGRLMR